MILPHKLKKEIPRIERIIALSPHLDDAIFSAGCFLASMAPHIPVTLVTVFTEPGAHHTLSARKFISLSGFSTAHALFEERRKEDAALTDRLGIQALHWGFTDALWRRAHERRRPLLPAEWGALYPTYRWHIIRGRVARHDQLLIHEVREKIRELLGDAENTLLMYPEALGHHVDHIIVKEAVRALPGTHVIWADLPYLLNGNKMRAREFERIAVPAVVKRSLSAEYPTQFEPVFGALTNDEMFSAEYLRLHTVPS